MCTEGETLNLSETIKLKMPKASSEDLRWRAVWLNIVKGMRSADEQSVVFHGHLRFRRGGSGSGDVITRSCFAIMYTTGVIHFPFELN